MNEPITTKNAIIKSAYIGIQDHGFLSVDLHLEYDCGGQCFGGYALHMPKGSRYYKESMPLAGEFIYRVLEIAGVKSWEELAGKTIRVKASDYKVYEIGHIIKEDWFNPSQLKQKEGGGDEL